MTLSEWLVVNHYASYVGGKKCYDPFGDIPDTHCSAICNGNTLYSYRSRKLYRLRDFSAKFGVWLDVDKSFPNNDSKLERAGFSEGEVLFLYNFENI